MAFPDYATYLANIAAPYQRIQDTKNSITTVLGRTYSSWLVAPQAGTIPSTSTAPNSSTQGALGQVNSDYVQYLAQVAVSMQQFGYVMLIDRLSHNGGLSGIVSNSVTTNLPTAATTRYTGSYVGNMAAVEIYTAVGATGVTISGSYTNQNGSLSIFHPTTFGGTGFREVSRFIILPLQEGDTGVKDVQSIKLSTTTATAGNYGVTIFRPIMVWAIPNLGAQQFLFDAATSNGMQLEQIQNNACLHYIFFAGTTTTGIYQSAMRFVEGNA